MSNQFADVFTRYKAAVICLAALICVARTLRELSQVVADNAELIERTWNEHFA